MSLLKWVNSTKRPRASSPDLQNPEAPAGTQSPAVQAIEKQTVAQQDEQSKTESTKSSEDILFTEEWEEGDVCFLIEGRRIYAVKSVLSMWSTVFNTMFHGPFREKKAPVIPLPGKKFEEIKEFFAILHPPFKDIDDDNVDYILPLAREYDIKGIMLRIDDIMMNNDSSVHHLVLAEEYSLKDTYNEILGVLKSYTTLKSLQEEEWFSRITPCTLNKIYKGKALHYEAILFGLCNNIFGLTYGAVANRGLYGSSSGFSCVHSSSERSRYGYDEIRVCSKCEEYMKKVNNTLQLSGFSPDKDIWTAEKDQD